MKSGASACYSCSRSVTPTSTHGPTLFAPQPRSKSIADRATTGLSPDLLNRVASRLQILAWLYAFVFFMAAFFPTLLIPAARTQMLEDTLRWAPGVISIGVMEVVMNFVDYHMGGMSAPSIISWMFWRGILFAVPAGFLAAWPVNYWLLKREIKRACH